METAESHNSQLAGKIEVVKPKMPPHLGIDLMPRKVITLNGKDYSWEKRITPDEITELKDNEIFVFGSNEAGIHGMGASCTAKKWGAKAGEHYGMFGRTFAIPTKDVDIQTLPLVDINYYVACFMERACLPTHIFLVTRIGCGLAGYKDKDIAPMFYAAIPFENIHLPESFWNILQQLFS